MYSFNTSLNIQVFCFVGQLPNQQTKKLIKQHWIEPEFSTHLITSDLNLEQKPEVQSPLRELEQQSFHKTAHLS